MKINNKHNQTSGHTNRYLFSGKIKCGECGAGFVGRFRYLSNGKRLRRWHCGTAARRGTKDCEVGKLLRDDDAIQMLKTAVTSLPIDRERIVREVAALAVRAIEVGMNKNGADKHLAMELLKSEIQKECLSILDGEIESEVFLKNILHSITVFRDRHMELRLNQLPYVFHFV